MPDLYKRNLHLFRGRNNFWYYFRKGKTYAESVRAICMTTCMKCVQLRIISKLGTKKTK